MRDNWASRNDPEEVEIHNVTVAKETDKAILVLLDGGEEVWVPKSMISDSSEVQGGVDLGTLVVPAWWALKAGLTTEG